MQITGEFKLLQATDDNPDASITYANAVGILVDDSLFDSGKDIQGYVDIYSDATLKDKVFRVPVWITKPEDASTIDTALLTDAISTICFGMELAAE